jgi:uncharacterized protein
LPGILFAAVRSMKNIRLFLSVVILFISLPGCSVDKGTSVEEIVKFESDNVLLEGVLNLPGGYGKHPLAVFIHGSGRVTRSDYEEFVAPLNSAGIAVFRYDKRGVGASGGMYSGVDTENSERMFSMLASDAAAAIRNFKNDKRIDSEKIILIGGSQAGWIIPEINALTSIWLSVCISGPLVTVGEEIYYSELAENGLYRQDQADQMLKDFRGFRGYDPISRIEKMKTPSLWLFGGRDVSIPVKRCIHLFDSIRSSRNLPLEIKLYPEADHGLFNRESRKREDHVNLIVAWIRKHH